MGSIRLALVLLFLAGPARAAPLEPDAAGYRDVAPEAESNRPDGLVTVSLAEPLEEAGPLRPEAVEEDADGLGPSLAGDAEDGLKGLSVPALDVWDRLRVREAELASGPEEGRVIEVAGWSDARAVAGASEGGVSRAGERAADGGTVAGPLGLGLIALGLLGLVGLVVRDLGGRVRGGRGARR